MVSLVMFTIKCFDLFHVANVPRKGISPGIVGRLCTLGFNETWTDTSEPIVPFLIWGSVEPYTISLLYSIWMSREAEVPRTKERACQHVAENPSVATKYKMIMFPIIVFSVYVLNFNFERSRLG